MADLISSRLGANRALVLPLHETWMDLGRADDLNQAEHYYQSKKG
jgi:hypothetical protein